MVPGKDPKEEDETWPSMPSGGAWRRTLQRFLPRNLPPIEYKDMPEPYFTTVCAIEKVPELLGFG